MGPRGDMGGGEYGMAGPMSSGVGVGPRMGPGPGPQMGRGGGGGGGMYEVVEQDLGDGNVYHVQFKRSARNFLLGKTCQRDLQVKRYKRFAMRVHVPGHLGARDEPSDVIALASICHVVPAFVV